MAKAARIGAVAVLAALARPPAAVAEQPALPPVASRPSGEWAALPKMVLERQFAGPLQDTVIQRLRDPVDGTVCYLYLPISAPHSPVANNGFVQYGASTIGSINCLPAAPAAAGGVARR